MAFLIPDKTEVWNGVKVHKYFLTEHNVNRISMPTALMPDSKKIGITIHNTDRIKVANGTTCAEQYLRSTVNGNMKSTRVHFYVDETCIWWCLPLDLSSWHAADGNGNGNRCTISIECIMSNKYDATDKKAEDNAARLIAYLMDKYGWNINNLYTHTHWLAVQTKRTGTREYLNETKLSGKKWCPAYILPHFGAFENLVDKYRTRKAESNVIDKTDAIVPNTSSNTSSTSSSAYKKGDLVSIVDGAVYTNGFKVPKWVLNTKWYISDVSGSRIVLGKSEDGKSDIQSPIDSKYIRNSSYATGTNPSEFVCTVRLKATDVIYKNPDGLIKVGTVGKDGVYTLISRCNGYGKLKSGAGWIKIDIDNESPIIAGDMVKVIKNEQYNGSTFKVYESKYVVLSVKGDRAVISSDGVNVTVAINTKNIEKI